MVLLAVVAVILIGVIAVAVGRGGELDPAEADYRPVDLDEVTSTDVALMRPPTALFGYHREATDAAFGQIARAISEREVEIATLRRQLAEQLPVRTSPALRADPGTAGRPRYAARAAAGARLRGRATARRHRAETGVTKAGLPTRPPARLPAEPPAPPSAGTLWQAPQHPQAQAPASPLPSRPVSSWPPKATTKAGSLLPEPMPNSSMPHIPLTGQDQAQTQPSGPAGPAGAPGASLPSRPAQPPGRLPSRPATPAPAGRTQPPPGPPAGTHGPGSGTDAVPAERAAPGTGRPARGTRARRGGRPVAGLAAAHRAAGRPGRRTARRRPAPRQRPALTTPPSDPGEQR